MAFTVLGDEPLNNNGGFFQIAFGGNNGATFDASDHASITFEAFRNGANSELRMRMDALTRPWPSFCAEFVASPVWEKIHIPVAEMSAFRVKKPNSYSRLMQNCTLSIGSEVTADIAMVGFGLY